MIVDVLPNPAGPDGEFGGDQKRLPEELDEQWQRHKSLLCSER